MCLILLAWKAHPDYRLIVAANRDEFHHRPAAPLDFWKDDPDILAGRDLSAGGTWMGVTRAGRFAALTNYRDPANIRPDAPSRGDLVTGFLKTTDSPAGYLSKLTETGRRYNGFNLLAGDADHLYHYSNRGGPPAPVPPGVHGLSNRLLNTPWPKVRRGVAALDACLQSDRIDPEALFAILMDRHRPADNKLPETGVGLEWERRLSTIFIDSPGYGTRCASVLMIDGDGRVTFIERGFAPGPGETRRFLPGPNGLN